MSSHRRGAASNGGVFVEQHRFHRRHRPEEGAPHPAQPGRAAGTAQLQVAGASTGRASDVGGGDGHTARRTGDGGAVRGRPSWRHRIRVRRGAAGGVRRVRRPALRMVAGSGRHPAGAGRDGGHRRGSPAGDRARRPGRREHPRISAVLLLAAAHRPPDRREPARTRSVRSRARPRPARTRLRRRRRRVPAVQPAQPDRRRVRPRRTAGGRGTRGPLRGTGRGRRDPRAADLSKGTSCAVRVAGRGRVHQR